MERDDILSPQESDDFQGLAEARGTMPLGNAERGELLFLVTEPDAEDQTSIANHVECGDFLSHLYRVKER